MSLMWPKVAENLAVSNEIPGAEPVFRGVPVTNAPRMLRRRNVHDLPPAWRRIRSINTRRLSLTKAIEWSRTLYVSIKLLGGPWLLKVAEFLVKNFAGGIRVGVLTHSLEE